MMSCWCNFKCSEGCFFYRSGKCDLYQIESGIGENKLEEISKMNNSDDKEIILTSNQAREIADKFNKEEREKLNSIYLKAWLKHRKYIEENMIEQASIGKYQCSSENLYDTTWSDTCGVKYDAEELEKYLKSQIDDYFTKLGFEVIDNGSNYLYISWREVVEDEK